MSKTEKKKKRKWGDRRDGRWVKAPGLQTVMGYLMPKRTDCDTDGVIQLDLNDFKFNKVVSTDDNKKNKKKK